MAHLLVCDFRQEFWWPRTERTLDTQIFSQPKHSLAAANEKGDAANKQLTDDLQKQLTAAKKALKDMEGKLAAQEKLAIQEKQTAQ